jgi:hypothetical protein
LLQEFILPQNANAIGVPLYNTLTSNDIIRIKQKR